MDGIGFNKMNGAGNEIVMLDLRGQNVSVAPDSARAIAKLDGAFFDQLMVLLPPKSDGTAAFVEIWNNDGSKSGACGNGMRCVSAMELDRTGTNAAVFETEAGFLDVQRADGGQITVDMGMPKFGWQDIPLSHDVGDTQAVDLGELAQRVPVHHAAVVNVGNPHAILWIDDFADYDVTSIGPTLEHHPLFPEKANISLAKVISPAHIILKVWERGAGQTRACGSAACATAVAAARAGKTGRNVRISLPGGDLQINWRDDDHILMTGPWELEHQGVLPNALFDGASTS
ncbi:MAG: diaminopimelate epimerase [Hyphomicrobiales bacterium]|nr:diaminopimelate epimerase [Hyphomicrobiales bacterium]PCJ82137.1 MAG: diaminopimelate epimerase [Hyphomicrobiales bacterium]